MIHQFIFWFDKGILLYYFSNRLRILFYSTWQSYHGSIISFRIFCINGFLYKWFFLLFCVNVIFFMLSFFMGTPVWMSMNVLYIWLMYTFYVYNTDSYSDFFIVDHFCEIINPMCVLVVWCIPVTAFTVRRTKHYG